MAEMRVYLTKTSPNPVCPSLQFDLPASKLMGEELSQ